MTFFNRCSSRTVPGPPSNRRCLLVQTDPLQPCLGFRAMFDVGLGVFHFPSGRDRSKDAAQVVSPMYYFATMPRSFAVSLLKTRKAKKSSSFPAFRVLSRDSAPGWTISPGAGSIDEFQEQGLSDLVDAAASIRRPH